MAKDTCKEWAGHLINYEEVTKDSFQKPKILLCLDSYGSHWNNNLDECFDNNKISVILHKIPKNTTPFLQPLDCLLIMN